MDDIDSHPERVSNLREFADNYDWSGLEFPVSLKQIGKFEAKNDISVNVLGLEGKDIYILRNSDRSHREINLLMISEDGINHYTAIKHPSVTDPVAPFFSQGKFNIFHGGRQKSGGLKIFHWGTGFFYKGIFENLLNLKREKSQLSDFRDFH